MEYMFKNTQRHFETKVPNGASIWIRHRSNMEFVFAIPNGWDYVQQQTMRQAAIDAGLFPSHRADSLLHFVTEGEASVHFVSVYGSMSHWLTVGSTFGVVDAGESPISAGDINLTGEGGSTTDSTLYTCTEMTPDVVLKEAGVSECVQVRLSMVICSSTNCSQAAGVNVDDVLGQILKAKLANSQFGDDENMKTMIEAFEQKVSLLLNKDIPR